MARRSNTGRRSSTRKPVTLDLKAEDVTEQADNTTGEAADEAQAGNGAATQAIPEAEPVAFDTTIEEATEHNAAPSAGDSAATDTDTESGRDQNAHAQPAAPPPPPAANRGLSALGGGVIGAVVALVGAAGLQWGGVLPTMQPATQSVSVPAPDLAPLQEQIATMQSRLDALQAAPTQDADLETGAALDVLAGKIATLENAIASGSGGETAGLEAQAARLEQLEQSLAEIAAATPADETDAIDGLNERLAALESAAATPSPVVMTEALAPLREETEQRFATVETAIADLGEVQAAQSDRMTTLSQMLQDIQQTMAENDSGATIAKALAASGLKTAIDRGLPFMAELETLAAFDVDGETVSTLRDFAARGVPTVPQLADRVTAVANTIAATGSGVDPEASLTDRLMASARSLVQVRQVGDVEGDTPGAIAARIESRVTEGDLGAALAEWETLPDAAKEASADFADAMRARQNVDALMERILTSAIATAGETDAQ